MPRRYLAAAVIALYFCYIAWPGLLSGFSHDDLMNASFSIRDGWGRILTGNLLFFSTQTRPLGAVFYRVVFDVFGFQTLPFRVVGIGLMAVNLVLLYRLARRLAGCAEAGLYASLLLVWHGNLSPLFFGSGNIYDVLAFTFYVSTLLFSASARSRGLLRVKELIGLALLQICALNSKEFAATAPLLLLAIEVIWYWPPREHWLLWPLREGRGVLLSALLSGVYTLGKVFGSDTMTSQAAYAPRLSLAAWFESARMFLNDVTYQTSFATNKAVIVLLAFMIVIAALLRNRAALFGIAMMLLGPLPVMLISPRGLGSHYFTLGGLALWAGSVIADLRLRSARAIGANGWERAYMQAAIFGLLLLWSWRTNAVDLAYQTKVFWNEGRPIEQARVSMARHPEWWSHADRPILFVSDPFGDHQWASMFLAILTSRNPNLVLERLADLNPKPTGPGLDKYGLFLAWQGDQFVAISREKVSAP